jgi:CheY-like chemotaxis protein
MEPSPILIIDDDLDDLEMIKEAAEKVNIKRPIHFFSSGKEFMDFLKETSHAPFLILSDVNLPSETGFDIRKRIYDDAQLRYKTVPFIFWSTAASEKQIQFAYDLPAQGFFVKPSNFEDLCATFKDIVNYWQKSLHPKRIN